MAEISASIVSYGGYEEVVQAAASILRYTSQPVDLYIIDNASPDGTGKKLERTRFEKPVTVICLSENVGFGKGHNTVLPRLKSKYHFVLNPDILVEEDTLTGMCAWMDEHPDVKAIYPIHMNPLVRETAAVVFEGENRLHIIEPLDVLDFHNFMARSHIILTDSGGIQEEAPSLGKPVLVMRDTTERPEGVEAGTLRLTGTDEETIYSHFTRLLDDPEEYEKMSRASNPYGDGMACIRIADILEQEF